MGDALPLDAIVLATAACPSGYTRVTALDGKYLTSNSTYNASAGGAASHSHANLASHTHSISISTAASSGGGPIGISSGPPPFSSKGDRSSHSHSISGTSEVGVVSVPAQTVDPAYATVIICKRTS